MRRCEVCDVELREDDIRYAHSTILCGDCFSEGYTYCSRCDAVMQRNEANYDDCGDPYCDNCWEEQYDEDCPDNPEVSDLDRQLIIHLSRNWLQGKVDYRKPIEVNEYDKELKSIRTQLGLVDKPLYCYGLMDRSDYQITASLDLIDAVKKLVTDNKLNLIVQYTSGSRRIGISEDLRTNNKSFVLNLLKTLTKNTQASTEAA